MKRLPFLHNKENILDACFLTENEYTSRAEKFKNVENAEDVEIRDGKDLRVFAMIISNLLEESQPEACWIFSDDEWSKSEFIERIEESLVSDIETSKKLYISLMNRVVMDRYIRLFIAGD